MSSKLLSLGKVLVKPLNIVFKPNISTPNLKVNLSTSNVACVNFFNKCKFICFICSIFMVFFIVS